MQKKTRTILLFGGVVAGIALILGVAWWMNQDAKPNERTSSESETSQVLPFTNESTVDRPGVDANGRQVTSNDVGEMRQQLLDAGLPADKWAPSDIKKIIIKSSKQSMDPIAYARENFHGDI